MIGGFDDNLSSKIIIGTPGKLAFAIIENKIDISHIRFLIVDEADKTINMPET